MPEYVDSVERLADQYIADMEVLREMVAGVCAVQDRARRRGEGETAEELAAVVAEATQHLRRERFP